MTRKLSDEIRDARDAHDLVERIYPTGPNVDRAKARFGSRANWDRSEVDYLMAELLLSDYSSGDELVRHTFGTAITMTLAVKRFGESERSVRGVFFAFWQVGMYLLHETKMPLSRRMRRALSRVVAETEWIAAELVDELPGAEK